MKTLIVKYTPSGEKSYTSRLLDIFLSKLSNDYQVQTRDLLKEPPKFHTSKSIEQYVERNFKKNFEGNFNEMVHFDKFANELLGKDLIVLAYPIYNFSLPAMFKAWIDSVVQENKTYEMLPTGPEGKIKSDILILTTTGGTKFDSRRNLATPLIKANFDLLGANKVDEIGVYGTKNQLMVKEYFNNAEKQIEEYLELSS